MTTMMLVPARDGEKVEGSDGAVSVRRCGDCDLCCRELDIPEARKILKGAGYPCRFRKGGKGCSIHAKKPVVCREFFCDWMTNPDLPEHLQPIEWGALVMVGESHIRVFVDTRRLFAFLEASRIAALTKWLQCMQQEEVWFSLAPWEFRIEKEKVGTWASDFRAAREAEPILTEHEIDHHLALLADAQIAYDEWIRAGCKHVHDRDTDWAFYRKLLIDNGIDIARKAARYRKTQSKTWKRSPAGQQMLEFIECWRELKDTSDPCEIYPLDLVGPISSIDSQTD